MWDGRPCVAVSSTKGATGHLLGAAGAVEAAFVTMALFTGSVPPTLNLTDPDPAAVPPGGNFVPLAAQKIPGGLRAAITNSFGGGAARMWCTRTCACTSV